MRRLALAAALAATSVAMSVTNAWPAAHDTVLVSRLSGANGAHLTDNEHLAAVSADGRHVAFASPSREIGASFGDNEVLMRDLVTLETTLVSRADGATGAAGDSESHDAAVSADGRYVAFRSTASNLSRDDTDHADDVYVRDLQTDTTTLVSRATNGAKANGGSDHPSISDDGRYVAFASSATNLSSGATSVHAYVRDRDFGTTTLVSRGDGPSGAPGRSSPPTISADGRMVGFFSPDALTAADTDADEDAYVRDLTTGKTTLVSTLPTGAAASPGYGWPTALSADGRYVAFGWQTAGFETEIYRHDVRTGANVLVSGADGEHQPAHPHAAGPALSADGRFVAFNSSDFLTNDGSRDLTEDVFVRDVTEETTTLVSRATGAAGAKGNDDSFTPSISASGEIVAFTSQASNLGPADPEHDWDIYVHDYPLPVPPEDVIVTVPPPPPVLDRTPAVLSRLAVTPRRLRRNLKRGRVTYRLTEPAEVTLTLERKLNGQRLNGRCVARRAGTRRRACTRYVRSPGRFVQDGRAGENRLRLLRGWCGCRLRAGRYRLTAQAVDSASNVSVPARATFRILKAR